MKRLIVGLAAFLLGIHTTYASVYVPDDVSPGGKYHLAFVTDGATMARSADIDYYNRFVNDEANRTGAITDGLGVEWFAIGSTVDVYARDNARVTAPVFLLDGTKVADGFSDLWDGDLDNPLNLDQFGVSQNRDVWTGTNPGGSVGGLRALGDADGWAFYGHSGDTSDTWVTEHNEWTYYSRRMYSLSEELVAPIPEPTTFAIWGLLGAIGLAAGYRRRRRT